MSGRVALGIDLGTTNCCVGVFKNGKVEIVINETGSRLTPSYVAFTDTEVLVGSAAKQQAGVNAENTVFEVKRLIGRKFEDGTVQENIKQWPFKVVDHNGAPKIKVLYRNEEKIVAPEQIAAELLRKMKEISKTFIGEDVEDAVITVPAYFSDSQRQATLDAGRIAGLNVLALVNEPTAAAFAYCFERSKDGNILVFDWGGGTLDVSIMAVQGNNFSVKAVGGDGHLGGCDLDTEILKKMIQNIQRKHGIDIRSNHKALGRLRRACENAKMAISGADKTDISIDCLFGEKDFKETLVRTRFEDVCYDHFEKTIFHVENVLKDAQMNKTDICEVVLVGGSSRIPKVKEMLRKFFDGKQLNCTINPDEAVAYGAAMRAAMISGASAVQKFTLQDVVPFSLGMSGTGDTMVTFIKRNTPIPTTVVQPKWTTSGDFEEAVIVEVYEGEEQIASKNNLLGTFEFHHGEREKAGVPSLTFTFAIDGNGILHVSAANDKTEEKKCIAITGLKGRLSGDDIKRMQQKSHAERESFSVSDEVARVREKLESFCLRQKKIVRGVRDERVLSTEDRTSVVALCDQTVDWIYQNDNLKKLDFFRKELEIRSKLEPLTKNISSRSNNN